MQNLDINITIDKDSQLLVGELTNKLNDYLTNYMRTEGDKRIINYCLQKINNYQGTTVGD